MQETIPSKNLTLIMPMAGSGSRIQQAGQYKFKPFVNVSGIPLYKRALNSLDRSVFSKIAWIVRKDHCTHFNIKEVAATEGVNLVILDHPTNGPLETVQMGCQRLDLSGPAVVLDCDLQFTSDKFCQFLKQQNWQDIDGTILTFKSSNPAFSYIELSTSGALATKIVEKKVISSNAVAGCYGFARIENIKKFKIEDSAKDPTKDSPKNSNEHSDKGFTSAHQENEFYISDFIQKCINLGQEFQVFRTESHDSLGSCEDIESFEKLND